MKTKCISITDLVTSKTVYIDGKKVGGVQACSIEMDISKEDLQTLVHVTFAIKRGSLQIEDIGNTGMQKVSFSTTNEAFK